MAKSPKGPGRIQPPTDISLLTDVEKKELRQQAKESVLEEMKQEARDEYFRQALTSVRRKNAPAAQIVEIFVDIAPFLPYISIDGVQYFHGYTYQVERTKAAVMYEQMQRSWLHQDEIDGRSRYNPYRKAQNTVIGPRNVGQSTTGANGMVDLPEDMEV